MDTAFKTLTRTPKGEGSGYNSRRDERLEREKKCLCGEAAAHMLTKREGENKGRYFWTCGKPRDDHSRCKFFLWDDLTPRQRDEDSGRPPVLVEEPERENDRARSGLRGGWHLTSSPNRVTSSYNASSRAPVSPSKRPKETSSRLKVDDAVESDAISDWSDSDFGTQDTAKAAAAASSAKKFRFSRAPLPASPEKAVSDDDDDSGRERFATPPADGLQTPPETRHREEKRPMATPSTEHDLGQAAQEALAGGKSLPLSDILVLLSQSLTTHSRKLLAAEKSRDMARAKIVSQRAEMSSLGSRIKSLEAQIVALNLDKAQLEDRLLQVKESSEWHTLAKEAKSLT